MGLIQHCMGMAVIHRTHAFVLLLLVSYIAMADARTLNIGGQTIALLESCDSDHKLKVQYGDSVLCAPATTNTLTNAIHVQHNGTIYAICNGACGGDSGEYVMPETPPEPIVLPSTCEGPQPNEKAYLLSDGSQYFDTQVPVNSRDNIEVTAQVVNGAYARLFGNKGTSCQFDMTLNNNGNLVLFMGTGYATSPYPVSDSRAKIVYKTETSQTKKTHVTKYFYADNDRLNNSSKKVNDCTDANHTMLVLDNDLSSIDQTNSGGIKLYRIRMWDESNKLIHDFRPVAKGTDLCGVTPPTNAMWDFVTKKLYYPAGTGQMGYGVDP